MAVRKWAAAAIVALVAIAGVARAQDASSSQPAPDKSGFTLVNPTPGADLRAFCTDRPTKGTAPCTVDAGHFQIESDVVNVTWDTSGGADTTTVLYTNPTFKVGLTNTLDLEVNISPYETITSKDRASGVTTRAEGIGDLFVRTKLSLIGDDGGNVAIALDPYVKFPTANRQVGNGQVEEGIVVPIQIALPAGWSFSTDPELDGLKNALNDGQHANIAGLVAFSHAVSKTVTLSLELWGDENFEPTGHVTQSSADVGLAWIPAAHPNFQLDGGVNLGLNNQTPKAQAYVGVSQRF
jgi:hypothetical protein